MTRIPAAKAFNFSREYLTVSDISTITGYDGAVVREMLVKHAKKDKYADILFASRTHPRTEVPLYTAMAVFGILPGDLWELEKHIQKNREEMSRYRLIPEEIDIPDPILAYAVGWLERLKAEEDSPNLLGHQRPVPHGKLFHGGEVLKLQRAFQRIGKGRQEKETLPPEAWAQLIVWAAEKKKINISGLPELVEYAIGIIQEQMSV